MAARVDAAHLHNLATLLSFLHENEGFSLHTIVCSPVLDQRRRGPVHVLWGGVYYLPSVSVGYTTYFVR